jgi:hypothetical protein
VIRRLSVRFAPVTSRAAEYAPIAPACCNACRTCTTSNVVGLFIGGVTAAALGAARLTKHLRRGEPEHGSGPT